MCSPLLPRREEGKERKKGKVEIKGREIMGKERGRRKRKPDRGWEGKEEQALSLSLESRI